MDRTDRSDAIYRAIMGLSPRGYWPMQETSGPTLKDVSGNALDLTVAGGAILGKPGPLPGMRAVAFDGVDDKATRADEANLDLTSALSVIAFCSMSLPLGNAEITNKGSTTANDSLRLTVVTTITPNFVQLAYGTSGTAEKAAGDFPLMDARWMLIGGSVAAGTQGTTYKNGVAAAAYTGGRNFADVTLANTSNSLEIAFGSVFGRYFTGSICHVAIFPSVLADIAHKQIFQAAFG